MKHGASGIERAVDDAITLNWPDMLEMLLRGSKRSEFSTAPLTYAVRAGRRACVDRLIALGEDVNSGTGAASQTDAGGLNPTLEAVANLINDLPSGSVRAFGEVGPRFPGYEEWISGDWPAVTWHHKVFDLAKHEAAMELLRRLLDAGADPDIGNVLLTAALAGHSGAVDMLLRYGATVHSAEAILLGASDLFQAAIERGDDPELSCYTGINALMIAAEVGDLGAAKALLGAGANANATSASGWTPLMFATKSGNLDLLRLLLSHGATVTGAGDGCDSPVSLAKANNRRDILKEFRRAKAQRLK